MAELFGSHHNTKHNYMYVYEMSNIQPVIIDSRLMMHDAADNSASLKRRFLMTEPISTNFTDHIRNRKMMIVSSFESKKMPMK